MKALELIGDWPGSSHAVAVIDLARPSVELLDTAGQIHADLHWASITKLVTAHAALVLVDEGLVSLDDTVTDWGATLGQLLSHAGGTAPHRPEALCAPGSRRVYSTAGYELAAVHLERATGMAIESVLDDYVLGPIGLDQTSLVGSAGAGMHGPLSDLVAFLAELAVPTLLESATVTAERTTACAGLPGVLPGFGRFERCDWGLGPEVKGDKDPHWTPRSFGPATFGHFGQAGGFVVVEPVAKIGVCCLSDVAFGPWAQLGWPLLLDAVMAEVASTRR